MPNNNDNRARLSVKGSYELPFGGPGALLRTTNGILFPFTPTITVSQQIEYSQYDLVHTNYQQNSFNRSRTPTIQITGTFASQTTEEALYTLGVMHFLRVVSKMHTGTADTLRGTPPPVLSFSAYGSQNFHNVPVLVGSFNFTYTDDIDYIEVFSEGNTQSVPIIMAIAIDLLPQYSAKKQRNFNMADFASGKGYREGYL